MLNGVKIEGMDELIKAFAALPYEARRLIDEPATKCANLVLDRAKARIHNISGDLSKSLRVFKPSKTSDFKISARVVFSAKAPYGTQVELGHVVKMNGGKVGVAKAHPFLRPAADESKEEIATAITQAMNEALVKWGEK